MKNKLLKISIIAIIVILISIVFFSYSNSLIYYYSNYDNYIEVTGKIIAIDYNDDESELYITFSDLSHSFSDNCFKISGENLEIAKNNNLHYYLKTGTVVNFITAPKYFGDGYVMPIVSIFAADLCFLEFEEGVSNLLEWLAPIRGAL